MTRQSIQVALTPRSGLAELTQSTAQQIPLSLRLLEVSISQIQVLAL